MIAAQAWAQTAPAAPKPTPERATEQPAPTNGFPAEIFEFHRNSVFARTFFRVGSVLSSHQNPYGARFTSTVRGMGNGNVLVPPTVGADTFGHDPAVRVIVANLSAPVFGRITNPLNDGRVLQLGLRLVLW